MDSHASFRNPRSRPDDWLGLERSLMDFCGEYTMKLGTAKSQRELKEVLQKCKY